MRTRTSRIADCGLGTDLGGTSSLRPPCLPSARACLYEQTQFGGTPAATCRPGPARAGCTNKPNSARSRRSSPYKQTQFRRANRPSQGPIMRNKAKLGHPGVSGGRHVERACCAKQSQCVSDRSAQGLAVKLARDVTVGGNRAKQTQSSAGCRCHKRARRPPAAAPARGIAGGTPEG